MTATIREQKMTTNFERVKIGSNRFVLKIEDRYNVHPRWLQYFVVEADKTTLVEMDRALFGWNTRKITRKPTAEDWPKMTVKDIVTWKLHNHDVVVCDESESMRVLDMLDRTHE